MKKNTIVVCPNCNSHNPYYNHTCRSCNFFLRDRVANLNLGEIILNLIESPSTAFEKIIFAEKKNFVIVIILLISIRFLILSRFFSVPFSDIDVKYNLVELFFYFFISSSFVITILALIVYSFFKGFKFHSRFKDIFSVIIYSFVPQVFALLVLYPVEITVYGKYLFSNNPYPFEIKNNVFYVLLTFEIISLLWSFLLMIRGFMVLKANTIISIVLSKMNYIIIATFLYISAKIHFSL
jgi:hypothetical protein